jgi:hypothetical protein
MSMQGFDLTLNRSRLVSGLMVLLTLTGCGMFSPNASVRVLKIQQNWTLQPGKSIAGYRITGSLGDVSIALNGAKVYAPFDGLVQPNDLPTCLVYSSPELPAYVFRLCGLRNLKLGQVQQGDAIAKGDELKFATLRRQPDGTWTLVEPASDILERILKR